MTGVVVDRGVFEGHFSTLNEVVVEAVAQHFKNARLEFDRIQFAEASALEIDCFVRAAIFTGAQVFPVDIPTTG